MHKRLFAYTESIRKCISVMFAEFADIFVVYSMPAPIYKYARAARSKYLRYLSYSAYICLLNLTEKVSILEINFLQIVTKIACLIPLI